MLTDDQIEKRRSGIYASDVAALLGYSARTANDVWLAKTTFSGRRDSDNRQAWGHRLEPLVLKWWCDETGYDVLSFIQNVTVSDGIFGGTPDAIYVTTYGVIFGVEIKTADGSLAQQWQPSQEIYDVCTGIVPPDYEIQCRAYMRLFDTPEWNLAVLIGGNTPKRYRIHRDYYFDAAMMKCSYDFWERLSSGESPEADGSEGYKSWLESIYDRPDRSRIDAPPELDGVITSLKRAQHKIIGYEKIEAVCKNRIRKAIGNNGRVDGPFYYATNYPDKNGKRTLRVTEK